MFYGFFKTIRLNSLDPFSLKKSVKNFFIFFLELKHLKSLNDFIVLFLGMSLVILCGIVYNLDYLNLSQPTFVLMGTLNFVSLMIGILGGFCFLLMSIFIFYGDLKHYGFSIYVGAFLWIILGLGLTEFLPWLFTLNNVMLWTHVLGGHLSEFLVVSPDLSFVKFIVDMLKHSGDMLNFLEVPPMNGHTVVGGIHEGKRYVCVDTVQALKTCIENEWALSGANLGKSVFGIPDIYCVGV